MATPVQMSPTQALAALLDETARRIAVEIRTHVPGTIMSFSRANGRAEASVRVDMRARLRSGQTVPIGQVDRCPVLWPAGGGWCIDSDLSPGDEVCVVVFDRDITSWLESGGEVDPATGILHSISHAAVLAVSLRSRPKVGAADPGAGSLLLGAESGAPPWVRLRTLPTPSAVLEAPSIDLGDGASLGVARQTDPVTPDAAWMTWFAAVSAALNTLGVPAPLPIPPAGVPFARITGASTIVRAK